MSSEIRVNKINNRSGLSTVTFTNTGPIISGVTTFQDRVDFESNGLNVTSGSVGIGTDNPASKLHLYSAGPQAQWTDSDNDSDSRIRYNENLFIFEADSFDEIADSAFSFRVDGTNIANEKLRITSSGNVGIGTDNPQAVLHAYHPTNNTIINVESGDAGAVLNLIDPSQRSSIDQNGPTLKISSDTGAEFANSDIRLQVDGGTVMRAESTGNVKIDNGNLVFSTSGTGIDFSATSDASGSTSELLDDYEEGTWTPTFLDTGGGTATEDVQSGIYVKIGRMVYVSFVIGTSANTIPGTDSIRIAGIPFDMDYLSNVTTYRGEFEAIFFTVNASTQYTLASEADNRIAIRETSSGGGNVASTWSDVTDAASFEIRGSIWYYAN